MKTGWNQARTISLALIVTLCLNLIPFQAFAADKGTEPTVEMDGICEHHPFHTAECGYVEAVPETPCAHVHTDECWRQETHCVYEDPEQIDSDEDSEQIDFEGDSDEAAVSSDSTHVCSEDTGCVTKILDCQHQHDAECGYTPAVPGHPCEYVCPICSQAEDTQATPYYLLLNHSLTFHDTRYGFSEVIALTEEELQDDGYNLRQHVLEKDGMTVAGISCFNPETGDLEEVQALSPESFAEGGDPDNGESYLAAQALIEYQVMDGYLPVLEGDSAQLEDPYGIMPLTSFEGGNIKDITFVPADVLTVRLEYKYSPTGGLAGMDAADSQVFQLKVDRDEDGNITDPLIRTWDLPCDSASSPNPALEGFRIVLDPAPLNAFVNRPDRAEQAMKGELSQSEIQQYLEDDSFSVNVNNPGMPVYQWQAEGGTPPDTYEDYPLNGAWQNRYSNQYNQAWDDARRIKVKNEDGTVLYTAQASQKPAAEHQGANPLNNPQLVLTMTPEQCAAALDSGSEITITVYYRRNAGFYHVGHWVPQTSLSAENRNKYTNEYPDYNRAGTDPFDDGYLMVFLERRQGRVGALTNARANPPEAEKILSSFLPRAVNQKTIEANTRVDILYDTADRYGLIFQTEDSYIPRQYVNKGYTVSFTAGENGNSGMHVTDKDGNDVSGYVDYKNPLRQGYTFAGWKYEVRSDVTGSGVTEENSRKYRTVPVNDLWEITGNVVDEAVLIRDSDSGDAKMIYLYPVWTPDEANVRVVYWTEDLSGGSADVKVTVTENECAEGASPYLNNLDPAYLDGTPDTAGNHFSNAGSFTFMAPTNSRLDLSIDENGAFASSTDTFTTTSETAEDHTDANKTGTLNGLIDTLFPVKMPDAETSTGSVNTSKFYHPYGVQAPKTTAATYTVAADGSTVINIYYVRNVYTLDFTYYGEIDGNQSAGRVSGTNHNGSGGLVVATNTTAYSKRTPSDPFDYNYQNPSVENRWQLVKVTGADGSPMTPEWTVPKTLTISAKYDADLREVWPLSRGETIDLTLKAENADMKDVATFMSWGATAGPFNQTYRNGTNNESTIIGSYRSMSADIIANPGNPSTVHHLVAYWWNKALSNYRRNACYEVPGLTARQLLGATDTDTYDLKNRPIVYDFKFPGHDVRPEPLYGSITIDGVTGKEQTHVSEEEAKRRDILYLVPVNGSLHSYFDDYESNFIKVDENGEPAENGRYYAVRRISLKDDSKVYALGRQATSVSTNWIALQAPSAMPNMTSVSFTYFYDGVELGKGETPDDPLIRVDHDTRTCDNWGRTETAIGWPSGQFEAFVALGSAENPYDIWFYYDRAQFTIFYMVASRNSASGEYEIGRHTTIYGQNMSRYNRKLPSEAARMYSNDDTFKNMDYWTPAVNTNPMPGSESPANGLVDGYTRLCPDSAVDGTGKWECKYWSLDRSGSGAMTDADWDTMVTGNLRVFAQWTPPQYKVKFDFDGGSYNGDENFPIQTVNANVGYTSSGNSIPSPTKNGYVFNGWTWYEGQADGTDLKAGTPLANFTFETPITRNVVLKARWIPSARTAYNYKIWYLTDDQSAGAVTLPDMEGAWLKETDNRGTPRPDSRHAAYTHVLGCQYVSEKELPENTILSLAAVAIPGYAPVEVGATLALKQEKENTGPADTENVAYFYYRKSQVKSYTVRFQLWDKTGEEGILTEFTTDRVIADSTYFTPGKETWKALRDAGYYLVQMSADGTAVLDGGEPIAAKTWQELSEFVNSEIARFDSQSKGTNMTVTFKVAPYHYTIQYHVGTLMQDGTAITPGDALKQAMQAALDSLSGGAVQTAVAAGKNPTRYMVTDFNDSSGFTLKNPAAVKDPDDASKEWRFTGWIPAEGTKVVSRSRSVDGEYRTLKIERSEGDLEFLANWKLSDNTIPDKPPVDPDSPSVDPDSPSVGPKKPSAGPEEPGGSEYLPTELPDPNMPGSPELFTIWENGVPRTYRKVWDPETGAWIYVLAEDIPLYYADVPETGEHSALPWGLLSILSLSGITAACLSMPVHNRRKQKRF